MVCGWKYHSDLICNNGKIGTVKAVIDLLQDFTSSLVPCGQIWIGLANKPGIHGYCSSLPILLSPFYYKVVNKEVNISMRFISNLSAFNFFQLSACHTLPRVHVMRVMSQALSHPVREVFQLPHNSISQALQQHCLSVSFIASVYFFLSCAALRENEEEKPPPPKTSVFISSASNHFVESCLLPVDHSRTCCKALTASCTRRDITFTV